MERAGSGASEEILDFINAFHPSTKKIIILCGKGNNGGDGFVVAREMTKNGFPVKTLICAKKEDLKGDAACHFNKIQKSVSCEFREKLFASDFPPKSIVVDALLGTGLSGVPSGKIASWIRAINSSRRPVVALDVPSGLDSDSGKAFNPCVRADLTVTFGAPKRGLFFDDALLVTGILRFVDIGFPKTLLSDYKSELNAVVPSEIGSLIPRHPNNSNKFSKGVVTVIAGSAKYSGAPVLSASSALLSGAGLVTLLSPRGCEIRNIKKAIISLKVPSENGVFCRNSITPELNSVLEKSNAICVGPGMTPADSTFPLVDLLWKSRKKIVFDADALNIISRKRLPKRSVLGILTPHEGEMKRLCLAYGIKYGEDRISSAKQLAKKTGNVIVLKGCRTLIADPNGKVYLNISGCLSLASAGTGDVLAGLLASLCAQGLDPFASAILGVYIHGLAAEKNGRYAFSADKLIELIPQVMQDSI